MTSVLIERGCLNTVRQTKREDAMKTHRENTMYRQDWSDAFTNSRMPKIADKPPKGRNRQGGVSERARPCRHLDIRLPASRTVRQKKLVILIHPACSTLLQQP